MKDLTYIQCLLTDEAREYLNIQFPWYPTNTEVEFWMESLLFHLPASEDYQSAIYEIVSNIEAAWANEWLKADKKKTFSKETREFVTLQVQIAALKL